MSVTSVETADLDLLLAVARKDETAFAQFYDRYSRVLYSLVLRIVHNQSEAEDVLQEAFWLIWERAGEFRADRGTPFSWCVTIARHKAIDRVRASRRLNGRVEASYEQRTTDDYAVPLALDLLGNRETVLAVRTALQTLRPEERRAIELSFFDGLTQVEIAEITGEPVGTIKARIRRGMLKLRGPLARLQAEELPET